MNEVTRTSKELVEQVLSENPYPAYSYTAQNCMVECERATRYARTVMTELLRRSAHEPRPVHTIETKEFEERANAWHAVFEKMLQNNPGFCQGPQTGMQSALNELDRLYSTQPPGVIQLEGECPSCRQWVVLRTDTDEAHVLPAIRCACGAHEWPPNSVQIEDSRGRLHTLRGCQPGATSTKSARCVCGTYELEPDAVHLRDSRGGMHYPRNPCTAPGERGE